MRVAILQTNYLPWKGYFDIIHDVDVFVYYDEVQYTKNDWRNRNRIYAKNGLQWLTIPVSKGAVKTRISEVTLSDPLWQKKHLSALQSCYGKAPFFRELHELIGPILQDREWKNLSQLNRHLIETIAQKLGCRTTFVDSKVLPLHGDRVERLIGILTHLGASEYLSGPAAKEYLSASPEAFSTHHIQLEYKDYHGYPEYPQNAKPFEHGVSIIDLVAWVGFSMAPWYIWGWRTRGR